MLTPSAPRSRHPIGLRPIALVAALAAALVLAACAQGPSQPGPDPQPTTLAGVVQVPPAELDDPDLVAVAASLAMIDMAMPEVPKLPELEVEGERDRVLIDALRSAVERAQVDEAALTRSSVVEVADGTFLSGVSLLDADGGYTLALPDGADIPETLFRPAAEAIPLAAYVGDVDCSIVASDPGALVTLTFWQFISSAAPVFFTQFGVALGLNVTEAVDFEGGGSFEDITFVTLAYATAPTTLTSTGAACTTMGGTVTVDVPLVEGWNQVTWSLTEVALTLGARPIGTTVYSVPVY